MDEGGTAADILHVVDTFLPYATGGSEIYVQTLIGGLVAHGISGAIASAKAERAYEHDGVPVHPVSRATARAVIERVRPRVVHLHAYTPVAEAVLEAALAAGVRTVFTYLIPAVSCARGTMLLMGREPCDGRLEVRRCTACAMVARGRSPTVATVLAAIPVSVARHLSGSLGATARIAESHARFVGFVAKLDRVIATSAWVVEQLTRNGVPREKVVLCRFGTAARAVPGVRRERDGVLRLAFFGRLHATKGPDVLLKAMRRVPDAPMRLDIHGLSGPSMEAYAARLAVSAASDTRIAIVKPVAPEFVAAAMSAYDAVAIPSRWMETGPLVALEAFAAGRPVIGMGIGGIAETVADGVDGVLVPSADPAVWAEILSALARDPERMARLRAGVRPPRTIDDVARDMSALYRSLL